jgi:hypothetical protein
METTQRLELKLKEKEGDRITVFTVVTGIMEELPRPRRASRAD